VSSLSVVVLTLNEEERIGGCLESVAWADELIVVDTGSRDRTVELAQAHGSRIVRAEWQGFSKAKEFALQQASSDWILLLDADERVPEELAQEIRRAVAESPEEIAGYAIPRRAHFLGRWIDHGGWYPGYVVRLVRHGRGRFDGSLVHESMEIDGRVERLFSPLLHYTDPHLFHYFEKLNFYTSLAAEDLFRQGRRTTIGDLVQRPILTFCKMYICKRGFLDGTPGFILSLFSALSVFCKYAKLWELQTGGKG
jgi:(heptosyl)LPS beta-1,4-glucosyltransferase